MIDSKNEIALRKFEQIAPLLNNNMSAGEKTRIRQNILFETGWSERTLRRYISDYRNDNLNALKPKTRKDKNSLRKISQEILNAANELKREEPKRSVDRIIAILTSENVIKKGEIARSTLNRHLKRIGASTKEITACRQPTGRRFVRVGRNTLWQSDVKYGPYISSGKKKIRTYLLSIIDDATRYVCHSEFYETQGLSALEDCLRKAILKSGIPDNLYVDNGKIYRSNWLKLACARLCIRLMNAKPYQPEGKGKIERFNRTTEEFMRESKLQPAEDIRKLNILYQTWLEDGYNRREHSSLKKSPHLAFHTDEKNIRLSTTEAIKKAFIREETRKVDKSGCFTINGILFEAGVEYCRKRIEIHFDPFDLSEVSIYHSGQFKKTIQPIKIGEFCSPKISVENQTDVKQSRLLSAIMLTRTERLRKQGLIVFKEDKHD